MTTINLCPVCESRLFEKFWPTASYQLAKCIRCDFVWDFNPPKNPERLYSESYYNEDPKGGYANYYECMEVNRKTFFDRFERIGKKVGIKGRLLDVGCALGDSLIAAKQLGWRNPEGLEISEYAVKFAQKRGLKVTKGGLDDSLYSQNSFDVITCQDVIEHFTNPLTELKRIFKILKPGGLVFIITPDIGGILAKILGRFWYHYHPKYHLVYFSKDTIKRALKEAGFKKIYVTPTLHFMTVEYILNRLRFYSAPLFGALLKLVKKTPFGNLTVKIYTGELEAWAEKP